MKNRLMLTAVMLALAAIAGCNGSDKLFANSADQFVNKTVGPEYVKYVQADQTLTDQAKNDRLQNVASFRKVVAAKLADGK